MHVDARDIRTKHCSAHACQMSAGPQACGRRSPRPLNRVGVGQGRCFNEAPAARRAAGAAGSGVQRCMLSVAPFLPVKESALTVPVAEERRTFIVEKAQCAGRHGDGRRGRAPAEHVQRAPCVREVLGAQQRVRRLEPALAPVGEDGPVLHAAYIVCARTGAFSARASFRWQGHTMQPKE